MGHVPDDDTVSEQDKYPRRKVTGSFTCEHSGLRKVEERGTMRAERAKQSGIGHQVVHC